ncbi:MAG: hypothetical protein R3C56_30365 [Pirellulaceae bacterium]
MATFEWNADEFEFEAVDEMELLDSQLEVLDGLANAPSMRPMMRLKIRSPKRRLLKRNYGLTP